MLIDTYSQEGKKIGQTRLPKEIFDKVMTFKNYGRKCYRGGKIN